MPFWHRIVIAAAVLIAVMLLARLVDWWLARKTVAPEIETRYRVLRRAITAVIVTVGLFSALLTQFHPRPAVPNVHIHKLAVANQIAHQLATWVHSKHRSILS